MSTPTQIDPVARILADLDAAARAAGSPAAERELIGRALAALRPLYGSHRDLFTKPVLARIDTFKARTHAGEAGDAGVKPSAVGVAASRGLAASPPFVTVAHVLRTADDAVRRAFPTTLWVKGEVADYRPAGGHHYFTLAERKPDGTRAVLDCSVWRHAWPAVEAKLLAAGVGLVAGQEMLFCGSVRVYDKGGRLSLHVADVCPEFTLGQIEVRRRAVLARLQKEGLTRLNAARPLPDVPFRVAVVSSRGAAGFRDFVQVLQNSGYAFTVLLCDVPVQGAGVEAAVTGALADLARRQNELKADVVCLVRGGGSTSDLGCWDSYPICAAVARMPIPVVTGIGHERDRVAADEVAHTAAATPTAAAELLCKVVREAEAKVTAAAEAVRQAAASRMATAADMFAEAGRAVAERAGGASAAQRRLAASLGDQLRAHARRALDPHATRLGIAEAAVATDPLRAVAAAGRRVGELADQARFWATADARQAGVRTEALAHVVLAVAGAALDPQAARLAACRAAVAGESPRAVQMAGPAADALGHALEFAGEAHVRAAERRTRAVADALGPLATARSRAAAGTLARAVEEVVGTAAAARAAGGRINHLRDLVLAHDPAAVLRRGFSITTGPDGRAVRDAADVAAGATVVTRLAKGQLTSTVTDAG
jgi:exodeoxyribonuclease VII large subunit